ncbi:MAG: carbonic anhydrase, partial [Planctomycetes bacterium]|nr:carbonic anhydrase [Planctomycetota bacterium]
MRHVILPLVCALLSITPAGWTEETAAIASTAGEAPAGERHEPAASREPIAPSNAQALQRLMEGNARYVAGKATHPHQDAARRAEVTNVQKPIAIIVTCADSRVGPEVVFDQGLGDIFVLRVAGNVADDDVQASIEYAVEHLNVNLVMVLGHERCGAVKAALAGGELPGHLAGLI